MQQSEDLLYWQEPWQDACIYKISSSRKHIRALLELCNNISSISLDKCFPLYFAEMMLFTL